MGLDGSWTVMAINTERCWRFPGYSLHLQWRDQAQNYVELSIFYQLASAGGVPPGNDYAVIAGVLAIYGIAQSLRTLTMW